MIFNAIIKISGRNGYKSVNKKPFVYIRLILKCIIFNRISLVNRDNIDVF